ncbi:zinc finger protein 687a isoform X2 [Myripristis murdjan]|uniref:Zinc finger protein 687a n=1 Tax=Myripristis murdjan TaxID=586833 RepID=A0A667YI15_9TELE|nr:zinc finger protein 687a-like isoform X2 [Myripristis murdjan]
MGDMKTPDFDDLLAAFDIPDIDAKEAIQSSPEEEERDRVDDEVDARQGGPSSCFPCSPASQGDPPAVSVIVKNRVRPESYGEVTQSVRDDPKISSDNAHNPPSSGTGTKDQDKLDEALLTAQLGPKLPGDASLEPQIPNGYEGSATGTQGQFNGEPWTRSSPLSPTANASESTGNEGDEVGSVRPVADIMNRLKPLLYSHSSTNTGSSAPFSPTSSPSPPSLSISQPLHSHSSIQKEEPCHLDSLPSSPPPPQNGSMKAGTSHIVESDEEDSEPDLGSPLVIQESPETLMSSPSKFTQGPQLPSKLLGSPQTSPGPLPSAPHRSSSPTFLTSKSHCEEEVPTIQSSLSAAPQPQGTQDCLASSLTGSTLVQEEKYPEHVIDERDSPESPPPDQTGFVVPKRSPSPVSAPKQVPAAATNQEDPHDQEVPMESEPGQECRQDDVSEMVEGEKMKDGGGGEADKVSPDAGSLSVDAVSTNAAKTVSSPSLPLKVKIKTVKTPTGSITRTVTGVAPKRVGRPPSKGAGSSKSSAGGHNFARAKREESQRSQKWTPKPDRSLPAAAMLQDPSAVVVVGPNTIKDKTAAEAKHKVSPTAVSITKTAALPSVLSPARINAGGISMHSLGQKTLPSGMTLPSPTPLLAAQVGSRPASIVNSTGATISKSQSNLVEAFNKILNSKNLLPSYKPDLSSPLPAEWGLPLPAQGYRCLECGDAFALEQSLARHYDRRSLRIEVTCNHCAKRLAFFNKCSLLLHAREHKEKGLVMQCSHLVMKPLTVEQMIGQPEPTPTALSSSSLNPATANSGKKIEEVQYTNNKCPECQAQFCSKEDVAVHFQEIKPANSTLCTECSPPMLLSNSCSAAAHQRIHQACLPHVCPECGGTAKQPAFQTHLDETCLHFARRIGYRCSSCQVVFGGLNSVKSHIQLAHCDVFHKCPSCPMAFKSASSIQSHITAQHPTLTGAQTKLIYKCVMCDTVFTQKSLLHVHFDTHLANQKINVFKCPECTKLYSLRSSLMDHFKSHKAPALKQESPASPVASSRSQALVRTENSDEEEWREEEEQRVNGKRTKTPSVWSCTPCHARYTEREEFINHMAGQHGKILKKFPCNKCESSFTTTSSLKRHIRDKHKGVNRGFSCQFCTEGQKTFSSKVMLERHLQLRHSMDTVNRDSLMGVGGGLDEADSSSEQDGSSGLRLRRKGSVKMEQEEESTEGLSPVKRCRLSSSAPSSSSLPVSGFRCAPCGFTTEDQTAFLEHIVQHRTGGAGGTSLQCLQCGACFTSTTSLSRHRFITHKVRDILSDNHHGDHPAPSLGNSRNHDNMSPRVGSPPASPSSEPSVSQGSEGEGALACKVCGKHFEKTTDLNTHFRTHGMAFISARNAGKTT